MSLSIDQQVDIKYVHLHADLTYLGYLGLQQNFPKIAQLKRAIIRYPR